MPLVHRNIGLVIDAIEDTDGLLALIGVGHPITGQFQYDTHAVPDAEGLYPTGPGSAFLSFDAGHGITWQNGSGLRISVANSPAGGGVGDVMRFEIAGGVFSVSVPVDPSEPAGPPSNPKCAVYLTFEDPTGRALAGHSSGLPNPFPSFAAWTADTTDPPAFVGGHFELTNGDPTGQHIYGVQAHVTALS